VQVTGNTFRLASRADHDALKKDLKQIYTAPTAEAAEFALEELELHVHNRLLYSLASARISRRLHVVLVARLTRISAHATPPSGNVLAWRSRSGEPVS
jgi:hypothetical protein